MLMGEPVYDKISDWAMEFHSDGFEVKFAGYSSFLTDRHGAYKAVSYTHLTLPTKA